MDKQSEFPSHRPSSGPELTGPISAREALRAPPTPFMPAVVLDEQSLNAAAVSDPMRETIKLLAQQIRDEVVLPTLATETREELFRVLISRLPKFQTTMSALAVLIKTTPAGVALAAQAEGAEGFVADARKIAGEAAADEVLFGESTYASALRIVKRFRGLPDPRDPEEDQRHAAKFNFSSSLFSLGLWMISTIAHERSHATPVSTDMAFEVFRLGALDCYISARSSLALRLPEEEEECTDPLPMDEEDLALANAC